jgi:hypothetical protein
MVIIATLVQAHLISTREMLYRTPCLVGQRRILGRIRHLRRADGEARPPRGDLGNRLRLVRINRIV